MRFLKLENLILPVAQLKSVTTPTQADGTSIVRVAIHALSDTFDFDGQAGSRVYAQLQGIAVSINPPISKFDTINVTLAGETVIPAYLELAGDDTPVLVTIDGKPVLTSTIEWADLATDFGNGQIGVELRLSVDPDGITRQFTGEIASEVYDILAALAGMRALAAWPEVTADA
jgi:hypothetical protein